MTPLPLQINQLSGPEAELLAHSGHPQGAIFNRPGSNPSSAGLTDGWSSLGKWCMRTHGHLRPSIFDAIADGTVSLVEPLQLSTSQEAEEVDETSLGGRVTYLFPTADATELEADALLRGEEDKTDLIAPIPWDGHLWRISNPAGPIEGVPEEATRIEALRLSLLDSAAQGQEGMWHIRKTAQGAAVITAEVHDETSGAETMTALAFLPEGCDYGIEQDGSINLELKGTLWSCHSRVAQDMTAIMRAQPADRIKVWKWMHKNEGAVSSVIDDVEGPSAKGGGRDPSDQYDVLKRVLIGEDCGVRSADGARVLESRAETLWAGRDGCHLPC